METLPSEDETLGKYWAPIIIACAKEPKGLTPKYLHDNFYGAMLKDVGTDIVHYYMYDELPESEEKPATPE